MVQRIDPVKTTEEIKATYLDFLSTTFSLRNPELAEKFKQTIRRSNHLFQGLILQANPHYRSRRNLVELAQDPHSGISPEFLNYAPTASSEQIEQALKLNRPLFAHQETALKLAAQGQNLIVATGTGSGKTESFLYPILNELLKERAANHGQLSPGVRAMLIYPMNALANDQIKRLRTLIPPETGITFGRYTGQTHEKLQKALDEYEQEFFQKPPSNEWICRDQIRAQPPHILLTNYAMLEYLLMRPQDAEIFQMGSSWKFIVLDEAHVYKGALGTEIGYLMGKLKDRVAPHNSEKIQCIATSATIGNDNSASVRQQVTKAISVLFGAPFSDHNLIVAEKVPVSERLNFNSWGEGKPEFYAQLAEILNLEPEWQYAQAEQTLMDLIPLAERSGYPEEEDLNQALFQLQEHPKDSDCISVWLYELLKGDRRIQHLSELLEQSPLSFEQALRQVFPDHDALTAQTALVQLIDLATHARDPLHQVPLLMARYHFFARSLEALSIAFPGSAETELLLGKFSQFQNPEGQIPAFELQACIRCGANFLHGFRKEKEGQHLFVSYPERTNLENQRRGIYLSIDLETPIESSEDELALEEPDEKEQEQVKQGAQPGTILANAEKLCVHCGRIESVEGIHCCAHPRILEVREVLPKDQRSRIIRTCPSCGGRKAGQSIIQSFRTNENAAAFVLGRTLFQNIPATEEAPQPTKQQENTPPVADIEDPFALPLQPKYQSPHSKNGKPRLLAFSDSRRDAAFFSSYMQQQANKILHRQLIYQVLQKAQQAPGQAQGIQGEDLAPNILQEAILAGILPHDRLESKQAVSRWLYAELCGIQSRHNLEGVGLVHWHLHPDILQQLHQFWQQQSAFFAKFGVDYRALVGLIENWLGYLRRRSVVTGLQNQDNFTDAYFWPRNRPYSIRLNTLAEIWSVGTWLPQKGQNGRSEFLQKFWEKVQIPATDPQSLLGPIWTLLNRLQIQGDPLLARRDLKQLWHKESAQKEESVFQLSAQAWQVSLTPPELPELEGLYGWFRCQTCGTIHSVNLNQICTTFRCKGQLVPIQPETYFQHHYFRRMYLGQERVPIFVQEHTAQITAKEGALRQQQFLDDHAHLNMLSCSTTFELGVDVGQLHAVYMRNIPPSIANYVQRAGRAARRLDATAYILTFARARSHELYYFREAMRLVSGEVNPPLIPAHNLDIARRHLHSMVLSAFFKAHPHYFLGPDSAQSGEVKWLFFNGPGKDICAVLAAWLESRPAHLQQALKRVFLSPIAEELGLEDWKWVPELVGEPRTGGETEDLPPELAWEGILGKAQAEIIGEYREYENLYNLPENHKKPKLLQSLLKQCERISTQQILSYLPSRGVLPKFGFPVDVVPLTINSPQDWAKQISLERDLRIAISEFAPGCALIANGKVIQPYGIQKAPRKGWREYQFHICGNCGRFKRSQGRFESLPKDCECHNFSAYKQGNFIIPEYGFTTAQHLGAEEPVEVPPKRTYTSQVYFSRYDMSEEPQLIPVGNSRTNSALTLDWLYSPHGKLVVINDNNGKNFYICRSCGYGAREQEKGVHKAPWGLECDNKGGLDKDNKPFPPLSKLALGHEFKTDVLELRFSGVGLNPEYGQDLWLSLLSALVRGACQELEIEEENLDGTLGSFSGGPFLSLYLYDTFPGGAGFVYELSGKLKQVFEAALHILENCQDCSENQSCPSCIQRNQNQFAHDILKRGPAAKFLRILQAELFNDSASDFFPPGHASSAQWLRAKLKQAQTCTLVVENFLALEAAWEKWSTDLYQAALSGCHLHLLLFDPHKHLFQPQHIDKVKGLLWLAQAPHVKISTFDQPLTSPVRAMLEKSGETTLATWKSGQDSPFLAPNDNSLGVQYLVGPNHPLLNSFKDLLSGPGLRHWPIEAIQKSLKTLHYFALKSGQFTTWAELLLPYLPENLAEVNIYDRYLRHERAAESLLLFLDMLETHAKQHQLSLNISLTTSYGEFNLQRSDPRRADEEKRFQEQTLFRQLKADMQNGKRWAHLHPHNLQTLPIKQTEQHQRFVELRSPYQVLHLKLEKGFDILKKRFNQFFVSEDSYLVLTETQES